jgi:hypothetical protein
MAEVEATRSGIAGCYLSRPQMTALLQLAGEEGLARQQIVKRAILRELVAAGKLSSIELEATVAKQKVLAQFPHSNLKPVTDLRMAREVTEEEKEQQAKKEAERASMERVAENLRRIRAGEPTLDQEEAARAQARRRRRRRA